jgi:hypothetical protein
VSAALREGCGNGDRHVVHGGVTRRQEMGVFDTARGLPPVDVGPGFFLRPVGHAATQLVQAAVGAKGTDVPSSGCAAAPAPCLPYTSGWWSREPSPG